MKRYVNKRLKLRICIIIIIKIRISQWSLIYIIVLLLSCAYILLFKQDEITNLSAAHSSTSHYNKSY
jgi:hypothetical protein